MKFSSFYFFIYLFILSSKSIYSTIVNTRAKIDERRYSHHTHKIKIIYIDLGANNGDSVKSLIERSLNLKKNVVVIGGDATDGSVATGNDFGKIDHLNVRNISQHFHVIAVEANNKHTPQLLSFKENFLKNKTVASFTLHNGTAISIENGMTQFIFDADDGDAGSTMNKDSLSAKGKKVTVKMLDIVTLFKQHRITPSDYVMLKIDVEGSEYEIVRRLITTGYLAKYVDQIAIEWHHDSIFVFGDITNNFEKDITGKEREKRMAITKKYTDYYNHLKWMLSDSEYKDIKIFNWGR